MPLSKRKCLKHDEDLKFYPDVKLEVFKNYSRKACLLECQARKIRDICNCLPYYYPDFSRLWKRKTDCDLKGLQCLSDITSEQIKKAITEMVPDLIFFSRAKFFGDQISRGPNFSGTKLLGNQKSPGTQMRSGTISVVAIRNSIILVDFF
jgi:hypothetical protein